MDLRGIRNIKYPQIYDFIADQLLLKAHEVRSIQVDLTEGKAYIKLLTQGKVNEIIEKFDGKQDLICDKKAHKIRLFIEDGGTDVKLHHLPPRMSEEWILQHMARFGHVLYIKEEMCKSARFPNIQSGVRIGRMQLQKSIPSYISIRGYNTYVTYDNQVQTCRHCGNIMHRGRGCAENRARLAAEERPFISYADITSGAASTKQQTQSTDILSEVSQENTNTKPSTISATTAPTTAPHHNTKRPAVIMDDNDLGKKGKSAKTALESRTISTVNTTGGSTSTGETRDGSQGNPETAMNTTMIDTTDISDDERMPQPIRSSRPPTRTHASSKLREASKSNLRK